jgi:acetamidase/formamidase
MSKQDYLATGLSVDLNEATQIALQEAVDFFQAEKGITVADAYALASWAVDLGIREARRCGEFGLCEDSKNIF